MRQQFLRITGIFCLLLLAVTATAGTWSANRFFYQPNVDARGASEKANFDTGINRVDAHLATDKTLGDPGYETLATALTTIGSSKVTLTIPAGTVAISSNTTIGSNIALKILHGGVFSISGGITLTISGPIDAGPYQIFSGTGTASLGGVSTIYDVWYASPPSNPGSIAAPVGCRFVKTAGGAPIVYNKESGTGTSGWVASSGGGSSSFTGLTDVPTSYTGQSGKSLRVTPGANGLEFYTPFGGVFTGLTDAPVSYSGQAGKALRVNSTANGLEFYTPSSGGASVFTGLTDVPTSYSSQAGKSLRVNSGANGLEFYTPFSGVFTGLTDAPVSYSGQAGKALRVNSTANGLEFYTPSSGGASVFTGLTDVPTSYSSQAGKSLRVNSGANGLEFYTPFGGVFTGLTDAPVSYSGQAGKALRVNSTANGLEFFSLPPSGASVFTGLTDVPTSYSSQAGKSLRVNSGANGLEFYTPFGGVFTGLTDAPGSYSGQAGKALRVNSTANGLEFYNPSSGGASVFTGLTDAPSTYSGQSGKSLRVNSTASGLEFYTPSASGGVKPFNTLGEAGYSTLSEALATIGSNATTLIIPTGTGAVPITSNTTIPANVDLWIYEGSKFDVANGATLTINGSIAAGPYQIFSWSGTGAIKISGSSTHRFLLDWWGPIASAPSNYVGDNGPIFQKALNGMGASQILFVRNGIWQVTTPVTYAGGWRTGVKIEGQSKDGTFIYVNVGSTNDAFTFGDLNGQLYGMRLDNLTFAGPDNCCKSILNLNGWNWYGGAKNISISAGSSDYAVKLLGMENQNWEFDFNQVPAFAAGISTGIPGNGIFAGSNSNGGGTYNRLRVRQSGRLANGKYIVYLQNQTDWTVEQGDFENCLGSDAPYYNDNYMLWDDKANFSTTISKLAQVFTLDGNTTIKEVLVWLGCTNNPKGNVTINIYATSGGVPTGSPIASVTPGFNSARFNYGHPRTYTGKIHGGGIKPAAGQYALVVEYTAADDTNKAWVNVKNGGTYSGGNGYYYDTSWHQASWAMGFCLNPGFAVAFDNCNHCVLEPSHFEGNNRDVLVKNSQQITLGGMGFGWLEVQNSRNIEINAQDLVYAYIDPLSHGITWKGGYLQYGFEDYGDTAYQEGTADSYYDTRPAQNIKGNATPLNYVTNSMLDRWQTSLPDGGWSSSNTTWTQCGVGLTDTTHRRSPFCAKAVITGSPGYNLQYSLPADKLAQIAGNWVTYSIWINVPGGQSWGNNQMATFYPSISIPAWSSATSYRVGDMVSLPGAPAYVICVQAGTSGGSQPSVAGLSNKGDTVGDGSATTGCVWAVTEAGALNGGSMDNSISGAEWQRFSTSYFVPRNATSFCIPWYIGQQAGGGASTLYLAEPSLVIGDIPPRGVLPSAPESPSYLQVGGFRMDWGTAAPTDGRWCNRGDVRFRSDATSGQTMGWVCTGAGVAGSGAVWKPMAALTP